MKSFVSFIAIATLAIILNAHADQGIPPAHTLPEEPTKLYVPSDYSDVFAIQLDNDALYDEEELENMEEMQKANQAANQEAPAKK
ncbi:MAG: hypothetical protein LLG04_01160 [Parachlamydia sp.]|nr:hypothetical protein [Parachlamydia sp.]